MRSGRSARCWLQLLFLSSSSGSGGSWPLNLEEFDYLARKGVEQFARRKREGYLSDKTRPTSSPSLAKTYRQRPRLRLLEWLLQPRRLHILYIPNSISSLAQNDQIFCLSLTVLWWDLQFPLLSFAHVLKTLVPTTNDLASSDCDADRVGDESVSDPLGSCHSRQFQRI